MRLAHGGTRATPLKRLCALLGDSLSCRVTEELAPACIILRQREEYAGSYLPLRHRREGELPLRAATTAPASSCDSSAPARPRWRYHCPPAAHYTREGAAEGDIPPAATALARCICLASAIAMPSWYRLARRLFAEEVPHISGTMLMITQARPRLNQARLAALAASRRSRRLGLHSSRA